MPGILDEVLTILDERMEYARKVYRGQELKTVLDNLEAVKNHIYIIINGDVE